MKPILILALAWLRVLLEIPSLLLRALQHVGPLVQNAPRLLFQFILFLRTVLANLHLAVQVAILITPPAAIIYGIATGQSILTILLWTVLVPLAAVFVLSLLPILVIVGLCIMVGLMLRGKDIPPVPITIGPAAPPQAQALAGPATPESAPAPQNGNGPAPQATPEPQVSVHEYLRKSVSAPYADQLPYDIASCFFMMPRTGEAPFSTSLPLPLEKELLRSSRTPVTLDFSRIGEIRVAVQEITGLIAALQERMYDLVTRQNLLYELNGVVLEGLESGVLKEQDQQSWQQFVGTCYDALGTSLRIKYSLLEPMERERTDYLWGGFPEEELHMLALAVPVTLQRVVNGTLSKLDLDCIVYAQRRYEALARLIEPNHAVVDAVLERLIASGLVSQEKFAQWSYQKNRDQMAPRFRALVDFNRQMINTGRPTRADLKRKAEEFEKAVAKIDDSDFTSVLTTHIPSELSEAKREWDALNDNDPDNDPLLAEEEDPTIGKDRYEPLLNRGQKLQLAVRCTLSFVAWPDEAEATPTQQPTDK